MATVPERVRGEALQLVRGLSIEKKMDLGRAQMHKVMKALRDPLALRSAKECRDIVIGLVKLCRQLGFPLATELAGAGYYQIPNREFIDLIAQEIMKINPKGFILEVGAGDGWLTDCINIMLRTASFRRRVYPIDIKASMGVEGIMHSDALRKYNPEMVVMCWATPVRPVDLECLKHPSVKHMLLIGESMGGASGTNGFFKEVFGNDRYQVKVISRTNRSCCISPFDIDDIAVGLSEKFLRTEIMLISKPPQYWPR